MEQIQKQVTNDGYRDNSAGDKTSDTLYGIENIVGTKYDDTIKGATNSRANLSVQLDDLKNLSDGDTLTISVDGNDVTINIDSSYDDTNKLEKIADVLNDDSNVNQNFQAFAIDYNGDDKEDVITIVSKIVQILLILILVKMVEVQQLLILNH